MIPSLPIRMSLSATGGKESLDKTAGPEIGSSPSPRRHRLGKQSPASGARTPSASAKLTVAASAASRDDRSGGTRHELPRDNLTDESDAEKKREQGEKRVGEGEKGPQREDTGMTGEGQPPGSAQTSETISPKVRAARVQFEQWRRARLEQLLEAERMAEQLRARMVEQRKAKIEQSRQRDDQRRQAALERRRQLEEGEKVLL